MVSFRHGFTGILAWQCISQCNGAVAKTLRSIAQRSLETSSSTSTASASSSSYESCSDTTTQASPTSESSLTERIILYRYHIYIADGTKSHILDEAILTVEKGIQDALLDFACGVPDTDPLQSVFQQAWYSPFPEDFVGKMTCAQGICSGDVSGAISVLAPLSTKDVDHDFTCAIHQLLNQYLQHPSTTDGIQTIRSIEVYNNMASCNVKSETTTMDLSPTHVVCIVGATIAFLVMVVLGSNTVNWLGREDSKQRAAREFPPPYTATDNESSEGGTDYDSQDELGRWDEELPQDNNNRRSGTSGRARDNAALQAIPEADEDLYGRNGSDDHTMVYSQDTELVEHDQHEEA